jgi:hypothetical protein
LGRKGATPIQRSFHSGLLGRIQAVKFIRHNTSRRFRAAPTAVGRLLRAAGSKVPGPVGQWLQRTNIWRR